MTRELAVQLVEFCEGGEIYENYSGRGMYGKTTYGVVVDDLFDFFVALYLLGKHHGEKDRKDDIDYEYEIFNFRIDNLGRRYIIY